MELALIIYVIDIFTKLSEFSGVDWIFNVFLVLFFASVLGLLVCAMADMGDTEVKELFTKTYKTVKKPCIYFLAFCLVADFITFFVPDKETSYTMLAAYGVQTISESEQVQTVMGKSVEVFEQYMDQYLVEEKVEVKE